jgi:HK97 family phage major capsid protein
MKHLYTKRAQLWEQMQALQERATNEDRSLNAEEREQWDRMEADISALSGDIERGERAARMDTVGVTPTVDTPDERDEMDAPEYRQVFEKFLRRGMGRLSAEERELLEGNFEELDKRAQGTTPDAAGGYTVPDTMLNKITETMKAFGGLASIVGSFSTDSGNPLNWPTSDETAAEGVILGENTAAAEDDIAFGTDALGAYTYSSNIVRVSKQLIQDSGLDIEAFVGRKLGERLGRITAKHIANGTGSGQPQGVSAAASGVTGAVSATPAITYDNLVDLEHSVDPAYRTTAQYAFSDATLKLLRKLKDADGRPLWVPSLTSGAPSTLNGYAYTVDNGLPAPAVSGKSVFFGDFKSGYILRRVNGGQLMRFDERYAEFLQVGFLAFLRMDGKLDDLAAIRSFTHGAAA